jgi:hypothetical protein
MSASISEDINLVASVAASEIVQLTEGRDRDGTLHDIIECDDEDLLLARIGSALVELPKSLSAELWALMGQKVRTARLAGKYWVGRHTA